MRALHACYFGDARWRRMAAVLERSAARWCPGWQVEIVRIEPRSPRLPFGAPSHRANVQKLEAWARCLNDAPDGAELLLCDADLMILRPLDPIWDMAFDIAYTTKPEAQPAFNAGVLFVRTSDRVRAFFARWIAENYRLLQVPKQPWRRHFGGVNQAALSSLLKEASDLAWIGVPCAEWNCEDAHWRRFDPAVTRVVHVKSGLRAACFGQAEDPDLAPLVAAWRALEAGHTWEVSA